MERADRILTTTPKYIVGSSYLQRYQHKCEVVPIGVEKLSSSNPLVSAVKKSVGNRKIIFFIGRLVEYKGVEYLIRAMKYLGDEYVLIIGGSGNLTNTLYNQIKKHKLEEVVILKGHIQQEDLGSYYQASDIFVLPSILKSEAFGVVMIEAMSFGKPIVSTKIPGSGVDWVNKDGISGINVEPKNPKQLANAIKIIANSPTLYRYFSKNSYMRYELLFKKEAMINNLVKIYAQLETVQNFVSSQSRS
jgi:rhamnosyl/mannosyltransferase